MIFFSGELNIKDYHIFRNDRCSNGGRYVNDNIQAANINLNSKAEALLLQLFVHKKTIFLLTVYRPPDSQKQDMLPLLLEEVNSILNTINGYLVVCGNFNLPKIDWQSYTSHGTHNM